MHYRNHALNAAVIAALGGCSMTALADPAAGSAYFIDPQTTNVINVPWPAIEDVNQALCFLSAVNAAPLTGAGDYIALMNGGRCNYGSYTTEVLPAIANATFDAQTQLTRVKGWVDFDEYVNSEDMPVAATFDFSVTQFPSEELPHGELQVNLCHRYQSGVPCKDQVYFQSGAAPSFFHRFLTGSWQETHAVQLDSYTPTSGSGRYTRTESWMGNQTGGEDYYFAYDEQHFRRGPHCLTRDAEDPETGIGILSYGLYDANGTRVHLYPQTLDVTFEVPNDPVRYKQYAGTTMTLTYANSFFWGMPSVCGTDPHNPGHGLCEDVFVIPYDTLEGRVTAAGQTYWVKWLNRAVRLAAKDMSECASLNPPGYVDLPTAASLADPSDPNSPNYIGIKPVVTDPPRVIDGVIQY
jgi:hypothetical protein